MMREMHCPEIKGVKRNLTGAGFKLIRFTNEEVLKNIAGVVAAIEEKINSMEEATSLIPRRQGIHKMTKYDTMSCNGMTVLMFFSLLQRSVSSISSFTLK